ncbi:kelch domain-containing protein [Novymonas esmeraldas]|uniref:Kelch domain-containing protein n=1 Tax=Novymonas esmeraldas TaxID=1808958 RepID=A0AAW0F8E5_9TRYP
MVQSEASRSGARGDDVALPFGWLRGSDAYLGLRFTPLARHPPCGCGQSIVCYRDRYLVLFGGGSLDYCGSDAYVYDMRQRRWSLQPAENRYMIASRLWHSAIVYGDSMIVYGGQNLWSPFFYNEVLELNLATWRWTVRAHAPEPPHGPGARILHNCHVFGSRMYVLMGTPMGQMGDALWYLDLTSDEWHPLRPTIVGGSGAAGEVATVPALYGCSTAVSGDRIYIFGGRQCSDNNSEATPWVYTNSLYEYNTTQNTWRTLTVQPSLQRPAARYAAAMVVHGGCLYLFGGDANQSGSARYFCDLWCLRLSRETLSWHPVHVAGPVRPSVRSGCAYVYARAALVLFGGELPSIDGTTIGDYTNDFLFLPLGCSCGLALGDNAARWLSTSLGTTSLRQRGRVLPSGAQHLLRAYMPSL